MVVSGLLLLNGLTLLILFCLCVSLMVAQSISLVQLGMMMF